MIDFFKYMLNNKYFSMGLLVILIILIILFFVVLFMGSDNEKAIKDKKEKPLDDKKSNIETENSNIDFNKDEYVKETTQVLELTDIDDVKPVGDDYIPEVKEEESPAHSIEDKIKNELPMSDFNFDELSKSISEELEKLKKASNEDEKDIEGFKTIEDEVKPVEITTFEKLEKPERIDNNFSSLFVNDNDFNTKSIVLPKLKEEINSEVKKEEPKSEPVLKDDDTPLFARFNQETYDLDKKD